MIGVIERARDAALIAKTDKRVWAASGFLFVVFATWAATGSWREAPPEKEKTVRPEKERILRVDDMLSGFQKDLDENKRNRAQLGEVLKRTEQDVAANQEKIDATYGNIVSKLDSMSNKMDQLAEKFGTRKLEEAAIDRDIARHNKKKKQLKKVDPGEL